MNEFSNQPNKFLTIPGGGAEKPTHAGSLQLRSDSEKLQRIPKDQYRHELESQIRINKLNKDLEKTKNNYYTKKMMSNEPSLAAPKNLDFSYDNEMSYRQDNPSSRNTTRYGETSGFGRTARTALQDHGPGVPMYHNEDQARNLGANKYIANTDHINFNISVNTKIDPEEERLRGLQKSLINQNNLLEQIESRKEREASERRRKFEEDLKDQERMNNEVPFYLDYSKYNQKGQLRDSTNDGKKASSKERKVKYDLGIFFSLTNSIGNDYKDQILLSKVGEEQAKWEKYTKYQLPGEIRAGVEALFHSESHNLQSIMSERDDLFKKQLRTFKGFVSLIEKGKTQAEVDL
jgi:hypothetical protein